MNVIVDLLVTRALMKVVACQQVVDNMYLFEEIILKCMGGNSRLCDEEHLIWWGYKMVWKSSMQ